MTDYTIAADTDAYTKTGNDNALLSGRRVQAVRGLYVVSRNDVKLRANLAVNEDAGSDEASNALLRLRKIAAFEALPAHAAIQFWRR